MASLVIGRRDVPDAEKASCSDRFQMLAQMVESRKKQPNRAAFRGTQEIEAGLASTTRNDRSWYLLRPGDSISTLPEDQAAGQLGTQSFQCCLGIGKGSEADAAPRQNQAAPSSQGGADECDGGTMDNVTMTAWEAERWLQQSVSGHHIVRRRWGRAPVKAGRGSQSM
ncbi:hypothetical protein K490DRAFT_54679 [Saccharata proteae CBS 121410]|uniref:Uncharacterized protein n=1 Tax=Saccharata proteae CBS 121410 TaxID=1314787 RepID=A0A9P4I1R2_9PEZI|nr:hypothetical protein K490DRAFT_54679 [Saccharata proteae CBS 121410]